MRKNLTQLEFPGMEIRSEVELVRCLDKALEENLRDRKPKKPDNRKWKAEWRRRDSCNDHSADDP